MNTRTFIHGFVSLMLVFGLNAAYAEIASCPVTPVSVVNQSSQEVVLQGAGTPITVPARSALAFNVQSSYFYQQCGLIHLSVNPNEVKSGIIAANAAEVAITIAPNGKVEQVGLTQAGFDLEDYISWHGYRAALS